MSDQIDGPFKPQSSQCGITNSNNQPGNQPGKTNSPLTDCSGGFEEEITISFEDCPDPKEVVDKVEKPAAVNEISNFENEIAIEFEDCPNKLNLDDDIDGNEPCNNSMDVFSQPSSSRDNPDIQTKSIVVTKPDLSDLSDFHAHIEVTSDLYYEKKSKPRGIMKIFNIENFDNCKFENRKGSKQEAEQLAKLFAETLGFYVFRYDNPTKEEIIKALKATKSENISDKKMMMGCVACAFLSYGNHNEIYAIDQTISIKEITRYFKNNVFAGIPKFFIFNVSAPVFKKDIALDHTDDGGRNTYQVPIEADFVYAHAVDLSLFIKTLCDVFERDSNTTDIMRMLHHINSHDDHLIGYFISQLRKEYFFFPPIKQDKKNICDCL